MSWFGSVSEGNSRQRGEKLPARRRFLKEDIACHETLVGLLKHYERKAA